MSTEKPCLRKILADDLYKIRKKQNQELKRRKQHLDNQTLSYLLDELIKVEKLKKYELCKKSVAQLREIASKNGISIIKTKKPKTKLFTKTELQKKLLDRYGKLKKKRGVSREYIEYKKPKKIKKIKEGIQYAEKYRKQFNKEPANRDILKYLTLLNKNIAKGAKDAPAYKNVQKMPKHLIEKIMGYDIRSEREKLIDSLSDIIRHKKYPDNWPPMTVDNSEKYTENIIWILSDLFLEYNKYIKNRNKKEYRNFWKTFLKQIKSEYIQIEVHKRKLSGYYYYITDVALPFEDFLVNEKYLIQIFRDIYNDLTPANIKNMKGFMGGKKDIPMFIKMLKKKPKTFKNPDAPSLETFEEISKRTKKLGREYRKKYKKETGVYPKNEEIMAYLAMLSKNIPKKAKDAPAYKGSKKIPKHLIDKIMDLSRTRQEEIITKEISQILRHKVKGNHHELMGRLDVLLRLYLEKYAKQKKLFHTFQNHLQLSFQDSFEFEYDFEKKVDDGKMVTYAAYIDLAIIYPDVVLNDKYFMQIFKDIYNDLTKEEIAHMNYYYMAHDIEEFRLMKINLNEKKQGKKKKLKNIEDDILSIESVES